MASEKKKLDQLVNQVESYVETWKQFHYYIGLAKNRKFEEEDETEFLEIKSVITQELESILATIDCGSPSREDVHKLIGDVSSLQSLGESNANVIKSVEGQWHRVFISLQAILGQLKVAQKESGKKKGGDSVAGLIQQLESYVETWKQFRYFIGLAKAKRSEEEDETEFLEIKSVITQELELILSAVEVASPSREEVYDLIGRGASLEGLSELQENAIRSLENDWHKVFIALQGLLGALKVQARGGDKKKGSGISLDQLIGHLENYVETWKQFNQYVAKTKDGSFEEEDENEFLEIKSVIAQELELIMSGVEFESPSREEVHRILESVPSLANLGGQGGGAIRNVESQWHKIYIGLQAILGQLKVQQREAGQKKGWSLFGWGKK